MIDSHAHIYDPVFAPDMDEVMKRAKEVGIEKIYMPAIDSTVIDAMIQMEANYPNFCISMMGLHPCYVKENYLSELDIVSSWLQKRKFAAIGEIGLDYYWDTTFATQQKEVKGVFKGNKRQITLTIAPELLDKIDEMAAKLSQTRAAMINLAIHQAVMRGFDVDGLGNS